MTGYQKELLELLDRSGAKLHALLTKLTLRADVAEELMQELFLRLSAAAASQNIVNLDAYAHRAAINLAFDYKRRNKQIPVPIEEVQEPAASDCPVLDRLVKDEQIQEILGAVGRLNGAAREAFVMRYIQQDSCEYIAEQLGKTPQQVRALCSNVMNHLREVLGPGRPLSDGKGVHDVED